MLITCVRNVKKLGKTKKYSPVLVIKFHFRYFLSIKIRKQRRLKIRKQRRLKSVQLDESSPDCNFQRCPSDRTTPIGIMRAPLGTIFSWYMTGFTWGLKPAPTKPTHSNPSAGCAPDRCRFSGVESSYYWQAPPLTDAYTQWPIFWKCRSFFD